MNNQSPEVIFCEGMPESPDQSVLLNLLKDKPITILPMGGKDAIGNFARGYFRKDAILAKKQNRWIAIRDRDLDQESPKGELQLLGTSSNIYVTGVTCVECYFLDSDLLANFIKDYELATIKPNASDLADSLNQTITQIRDYQAIRWALQVTRQEIIKQATESNLLRKYTLDLPNNLVNSEDISNIINPPIPLNTQAKEKIDNLSKIIQYLGKEALALFESNLQDYQTQFRKFSIHTDDYKFWFFGKDVIHLWLKQPVLSEVITTSKIDKTKRNERERTFLQSYYKKSAPKIPFEKYPDLIAFRDICWGQNPT
jgi:hypothetical protein